MVKTPPPRSVAEHLPEPLQWVKRFPFYQAGLAGYSDGAMRLIARRHGAPYAITEAMLDTFLVNGGKAVKNAELDEQDHPIAGQIMGSEPGKMAQAARILVELGYDVIDVNLACPVKKFRKQCRGGHLLTQPDKAIAILDAVRQAVGDDRPCTIKLRIGADDSPQARTHLDQVMQAAIDLGYAAAAVHGRTVAQRYQGDADWDVLRDLVQQVRGTNMLLFGAGDVVDASAIFRMIEHTGVAAVNVARGCIGNPWIFAQAAGHARGEPEALQRQPNLAQQRDVLLAHFQLAMRLHGERQTGFRMRKFGIHFSKHHPESETVAKAFIAVRTRDDWQQVLAQHYPPRP